MRFYLFVPPSPTNLSIVLNGDVQCAWWGAGRKAQGRRKCAHPIASPRTLVDARLSFHSVASAAARLASPARIQRRKHSHHPHMSHSVARLVSAILPDELEHRLSRTIETVLTSPIEL